MIGLHIGLSILLFAIGFAMRYGYAKSLTVFFYHNIPKLAKEEFDEIKVGKFVSQTSMKLGSIVLLIAMFGFFKPENFKDAIIVGWISFIIFAICSVTFMYKPSVANKSKKEIGKSRKER